jgi:hypothetical protein
MRESLMYGSVRGARGNSRPYRDTAICCTCSGQLLALSGGSQTASLRQLLGEQRKCMDGRPRPPTRTTHQRHWLCTAAMVLTSV